MEDVKNRLLLPFRDTHPQVENGVFIASNTTVVGDVEIGADSSLWFGVVVRGDVEPIRIGRRTNIQDLSVVHVTGGRGPATIGDGVTVGHRAVIHGCTLHDDCLIGIGAVILDGAEISSLALVGAGALVPPGMVVPPRTLALGVPAKLIRELSDDECETILESAENYVLHAREYARIFA